MKFCASLLLTLLPFSALTAADELSCSIDVLSHLGWQVEDNSNDTGILNADTCDADITPVFRYNTNTEKPRKLLKRARKAYNSNTSKCLFNRSYQSSIQSAVDSLIDNTDFKFLPVGNDPRDPFLPPDGTWDTTSERGYDIPHQSIQGSIQSLYKKPFVAECSTATQIAQLASLTEYYGTTTDQIVDLNEVGIGNWRQYAQVPSIAAKQSLFIDRKDRKRDGLKKLANTGHAAFYGQVGYIRPYKGPDFIDSPDNLGQNFLIVDITDKAVASLKARKKPLKELSKLSRKMWKKYRNRQRLGEPKETLREEMRAEFEALDPFFSDITVFIHPLHTNNFAEHMARQFWYNPRTPYVFEVYEDYQPGFFYNRYIDYQLNLCLNHPGTDLASTSIETIKSRTPYEF